MTTPIDLFGLFGEGSRRTTSNTVVPSAICLFSTLPVGTLSGGASPRWTGILPMSSRALGRYFSMTFCTVSPWYSLIKCTSNHESTSRLLNILLIRGSPFGSSFPLSILCPKELNCNFVSCSIAVCSVVVPSFLSALKPSGNDTT